jgi:hypothetical protein
LKILLFSDNEEESEFLKKLVRAHFRKLRLIVVSNNDDLIEKLSYEGPFGFSIIDCAYKDLSPGVIYDSINGFIGERPCLFLGTAAQVKDRVEQEIFTRNENNNILERPIDIETFKNLVDASLQWAKKQDFEESILEVDMSEFVPMRIKNFYLYKKFPYDCYVEVTSSKFIKALNANEPYPESVIVNYVKKGIKYFYLKKEDQIKFLEETLEQCVGQMENLPPGIEMAKTHVVCLSVLQAYMTTLGVTETVQDVTDILVESIMANCSGRLPIDILKEFPFLNGGIAVKSTLTAYVSVIILRGMGWAAKSSSQKMIICSILHDCFLENDEELKIMTLEDEVYQNMDEKNQARFDDHIRKAAELSNQFSGVADIDFIIEQHHELPNGQGFPHGWSSIKLTMLSCLFILAHNFSNLMLDFDLSMSNLTKLVRYFDQNYSIGNFKQPMKTLAKQLKIKI